MYDQTVVRETRADWSPDDFGAPPTELHRTEIRETRLAGGTIVMLVLLTAAVGALGYMAYSRGWTETSLMIGSNAKAAALAVQRTSHDAALTAKVKTALTLSKRVSAFPIRVAAENGKVTLSGQVPSDQVRDMAEVIAKDTSGVAAVENKLIVDPAVKADETRRQLGERVADLEVKTKFLDAVAANPELREAQIQVRVDKGTIYMTGNTDHIAVRDKIVIQAWNTDGVAGVIDNITVRNSGNEIESPSQQLTRRVEFNLFSSKAFDLNSLQIQASEGTAVLNGTVRSQAEKLLAERIALQTAGIQKVVNNLQLSSETTPK